jgi:hypothetical protein
MLVKHANDVSRPEKQRLGEMEEVGTLLREYCELRNSLKGNRY